MNRICRREGRLRVVRLVFGLAIGLTATATVDAQSRQAIALQDLANGRRQVEPATLKPFLELAGYAPTLEPNGCHHILTAYGSARVTVHVTLLPAERLLVMGIVLRDYSDPGEGAAAARTLAARSLPGKGRFDYDGGRLTIVHSLPLPGLSVKRLEGGLAYMIERIAASQDTWAPVR